MILSPSPSVSRSLQSTSPVQSTPEETCPRNNPTKSVSDSSCLLSDARQVCLILRERLLVDYARKIVQISAIYRAVL